jgi:hypothetical protein
MAGAWQNGVLMHYWYRALDRIVSPATNPASVLKKICCDEAVFAPQVRICILCSTCMHACVTGSAVTGISACNVQSLRFLFAVLTVSSAALCCH